MSSAKDISEKKKVSTKKKSKKATSTTPSVNSIIKKMVNLCNKKNLSFKDSMRIEMLEKTVKVMLQVEKSNANNDNNQNAKEQDAKTDLINALTNRTITTAPTIDNEEKVIQESEDLKANE